MLLDDWRSKNAGEAVLPDEKRHLFVTQILPEHRINKGPFGLLEIHIAPEFVSHAISLVSLLVWQKFLRDQVTTKPLITEADVVIAQLLTMWLDIVHGK